MTRDPPKTALRIGLKLAQGHPIEVFRHVWSIADEAGFDHCWAFDHLASAGEEGLERPVFEGWSLLSAMGALTARTRVGLLVTGMTYRHPATLAKLAVTVDHLTGGRLEFGIGAGWAADEQRMYGLEGLENRIGRLSEGLTVIKLLWTRDRAQFAGRYYRLCDAIANPKPLQQPHPPIWVGGAGPSTLRVAARYADVWNLVCQRDDIHSAIDASARLDAACEAVNRAPTAVRRSVQLTYAGDTITAFIDDVLRFHTAGFSEIIVSITARDPVGAAATVAEHLVPVARAVA